MLIKCQYLCQQQYVNSSNSQIVSILNEVAYAVIDGYYGNSYETRIQNRLIEFEKTFPQIKQLLHNIKVETASKDFAYFINSSTKKAYFNLRGVSVHEINDLLGNKDFILGKIPQQLDHINSFINDQISNDAKNGYEIVISGHQIGGFLGIVTCLENRWINNCEVHNPYLNDQLLSTLEGLAKNQSGLKEKLLIQITKRYLVNESDIINKLNATYSFFDKGSNSENLNAENSMTFFGWAVLGVDRKLQNFNQYLKDRKYYDFGKQLCIICPLDKSCLNSVTGPYFCAQGQYLSDDGICQSCPPGTFSSEFGSLKCQKCQTGYYQTQIGQKNCIACPEGYFCQQPDIDPIPCSAGCFNQGFGNTTCKGCDPGFYQTEIGQNKCIACPEGHECVYPENNPYPCFLGYYSKGTGNASCSSCKIGHYQLQRGQSDCNACPEGFYCRNTKSPPVACPRGETSKGTGNFKCSPIN